MNIAQISKSAQIALKRNSPAVLTGLAIAGTITTVYLTARAAYRIGKDVNAQHYEALLDGEMPEPDIHTVKHIAKTYWIEFIPPFVATICTIGCVVAGHQASARKVAAMSAAYSLSEKAFSEYKEKVVEQIGKNKELKVREAVAQDQVTANPPTHSEIVVTPQQEQICYEAFSGRYFSTTVEKLRKAENEFNSKLISDMSGSLNEFWDLIGLRPTSVGEELGWTANRLMQLHITTTLAEDNTPCLHLGYVTDPKADFWKFG